MPLIQKPCRCGKITKNFQRDIGPFFIGECCEEAGYDALGNMKVGSKEIEAIEEAAIQSALNAGLNPILNPSLPKGGRGKLMDMNVPALKELAKSKGIETDGLNKKKIVEAILAK